MQRVERQRTITYFKHLSGLASAAAAECQAAHTELVDAVMQHVVPGCDLVTIAGGLSAQLQQVSRLCAQQLVHEEWAERFQRWSEQALAVFGSD